MEIVDIPKFIADSPPPLRDSRLKNHDFVAWMITPGNRLFIQVSSEDQPALIEWSSTTLLSWAKSARLELEDLTNTPERQVKVAVMNHILRNVLRRATDTKYCERVFNEIDELTRRVQ